MDGIPNSGHREQLREEAGMTAHSDMAKSIQYFQRHLPTCLHPSSHLLHIKACDENPGNPLAFKGKIPKLSL